jgi:type II secretory pathway component HofQ
MIRAFAFILLISTNSFAMTIYTCESKDGVKNLQDFPCSKSSKQIKVYGIEKPRQQQHKSKEITLNFHEVEVGAVLKVLADFSGTNFVVLPSVIGRTTVIVNDTPWVDVFLYITKKHNLTVRNIDNTIYIGKDSDFR